SHSIKQICLDRGANLLAVDKHGHTAAHFACTRGDLICVKLLLNYRPKLKSRLIQCVDDDGRTILHQAAMGDHPETVDYLIKMGADLNKSDNKGLSPLLLSALKGSIRTCIQLVQLGADVGHADENGRNVVMLLLLGGTGKSRETIPALKETGKLQEMFNHQDKWGCSYMHIATRLGYKVAFLMGLQFKGSVLRRDMERSNPLHTAALFGRYEICRMILETPDGIRALGRRDHKGRQPAHIAAQHGYHRVVELILRKGYVIRRCHNGNTPLHCAAMGGNAETCSVLLITAPNLLNEKNGLGMTALHIAALHKNGEVAGYLLTLGAEILPDNRGIYFTTHLFNQDNYLAAKVVTNHKRWPEIMEMLRNTNQSPLERLVCYLPSLTALGMDQFVTESGIRNTRDHGTQFDFTMFQPSTSNETRKTNSAFHLLKMMINKKHSDLLVHPLCTAYLTMKWETYGRWVQLIEIVYYVMLCFIITRYALIQMPLAVDYNEPEINICVEKVYGCVQHSSFTTATLSLAVFTCNVQMIGKLVKLANERWQYFTRWINCWLLLLNVLFIVNCVLSLTGQYGPACGALTVFVMFMSWMNILLQMLRYRSIGLFVVMFIQVGQTIIKTAPIFGSLFIAFAITFHKLLVQSERDEFPNYPRETKNRLTYCFLGFEHLNRSEAEMQLPVRAFGNVNMAFFQTLMMMLGEYDHTEVITRPYLDGSSATIYTVELTFAFYAAFAFTMPISLMNLMIGLAVGDIDEIQRSATHQLIAQQVYWLDQVESRLPQWLYKKAQVKHWIIRPPLTFNRRKPHREELKAAFARLNKDLARIKRNMAYMGSVLDQTVQQTGMGSYETQQDVGIYSDDPTTKD
ncbi:Transient receptor potential cation channel subfamily A member 1, partial [Fasciola gigantica]